MSTRPGLDVEALYTAIDRKRRTQRLHFRDVAAEAGISASGLTRLGHGLRPDADGLIRLLLWLGTTDVAPFVSRPPEFEQLVVHLDNRNATYGPGEGTSREAAEPRPPADTSWIRTTGREELQ